ncbi:uncharacterized protein DSM5745_03719 [Aspergillus mulundensis]|uniref:Uncharacterized protein n=1 Tax=Aspergillus mulundensis TaxID=1810919 RepID=A0A3D8SL77_9EURO|nr:hypothetical protein DSM5745_03719 [Aspergillus mulundensis]RDW87077.1 hypothetical protein DSM5745_03719 [Aspergillus mulundensis]
MLSSARIEALRNAGRAGGIPELASIYGGWYTAPNGKRYFGLGTVMEIGYTHDGSVYVNAEPTNTEDDRFRFFDPSTDEDMPEDQYPEDPELVFERTYFSPRKGPTYGPKPTTPGLKPGDMARGFYDSAQNVVFYGVGRIVTPIIQEDGQPSGSFWIEPSRIRGPIPVWETYSRRDIEEHELPRSYYTGSLETQQRENKDRPRREIHHELHHWYGKLPPMPAQARDQPRLGSEHSGAYFAPDGQWFAGVGRVVAVGYILHIGCSQEWYVYVEPTGKTGGDYDFFHPQTREWMDELPQTNPIPGMQCTPRERRTLPSRWRDLPVINRQPAIGEEYHGRYCPPGAPKRDVYVGIGKVVKTGVDEERGRIWVEVVPVANKRDSWNHQFRDPWSGKKMPEWYWPLE